MSDISATRANRRVFLSYSTEDGALAEGLRRGLIERGLPVWSADENLSPGSRVASAITDAVRGSDLMVILVTQAAEESPWVQFEAAAAIAEAEKDPSKWVISVVVPPSAPPTGLLASYKWIQPSSADPEVIAAAVAEAADRVAPMDKEQERNSAREGLDMLARELEVEKRLADAASMGRLEASRTAIMAAITTVGFGAVAALITSEALKSLPFVAGIAVGVVVGVVVPLAGYLAGRARGRK